MEDKNYSKWGILMSLIGGFLIDKRYYKSIDYSKGLGITKHLIDHIDNDVAITYSLNNNTKLFGLVNLKNKRMDQRKEIEPKYKSISDFKYGYAMARRRNDYLIDKEGNELFEAYIIERIANGMYIYTQSENVLCGLLDKNGQVVIKPQYKYLKYLGDNLFCYSNNVLNGVFRLNNNKVEKLIEPAFYQIEYINHNRFAAYILNRGWMIIDRSGNVIKKLSSKIEIQSCKEEVIVSKILKRSTYLYGLMDADGQIIKSNKYYNIDVCENGLAVASDFEYRGGEHNVLINYRTKKVIPSKFGFINKYHDEVTSGRLLKKPSNCLIDDKGNIKVLNYNWISPLYQGVATVLDYNDDWGIIDKTGKEILKPCYDQITRFICDVTFFKKDDNWGIIDKTGKEILEPIYDFENCKLEMKDNLIIIISPKYQYSLCDINGRFYFSNIDLKKIIILNDQQIMIDNTIFYINDLKELFSVELNLNGNYYHKHFKTYDERETYMLFYNNVLKNELQELANKREEELKQIVAKYNEQVKKMVSTSIDSFHKEPKVKKRGVMTNEDNNK